MSSGHGNGGIFESIFGGMIGRVLLFLIIAMVLVFIIVWFVEGGLSHITSTARKLYTNPIALVFGDASTTSIGTFALPWQPAPIQGADLSQYIGSSDTSASDSSNDPASQLSNIQAEVDSLKQKVIDSKTFGSPSPYVGRVHLSASGARESDVSAEYMTIDASESNAAPIDVSGWSLQSAVSGTRLVIPLAASPFLGGMVNASGEAYLDPGASATINSGISPVGISFRENVCTGYLGQLQSFDPELDAQCPSPESMMPSNQDTLSVYGSSCVDYVNSLSPCSFPGAQLPSNLSLACQSFLDTRFSYNGCVDAYRYRPGFSLPSWRLYLGSRSELWDNSHDIIRLLDAQGRTVDVVQY